MEKRLLVAVGGFGSGKSALVRRLARQAVARGERPVLVLWQWDPFDEANDRAEGVRVVAPRSGRADPTALLAEAAEGEESPVLVEAPGEMGTAEALALCGKVGELCGAPRIAGILDAQRSPLEEARALAGVSALLLNKLDTAPEGEAASLVRSLGSRFAGTQVVGTVESAVTWEEIEGWPVARAQRAEAASVERATAAPRTVSKLWVSWEGALAHEAARLFVADPPPGTLRAKGGIAIVGEAGRYAVQVTGRSGSLRRAPADAAPPDGLLWITEDPNETELRARLQRPLRVTPLAEITNPPPSPAGAP